MTKSQAMKLFTQHYAQVRKEAGLNEIKPGHHPATLENRWHKRQAWDDFIFELWEKGSITNNQGMNWRSSCGGNPY